MGNIINGDDAQGTFFAPSGLKLAERKKWLPFFPSPNGTLTVEHETIDAIMEKGDSLLAKGILSITGEFEKADVVEIKNPEKKLFCQSQGLVFVFLHIFHRRFALKTRSLVMF